MQSNVFFRDLKDFIAAIIRVYTHRGFEAAQHFNSMTVFDFQKHRKKRLAALQSLLGHAKKGGGNFNILYILAISKLKIIQYILQTYVRGTFLYNYEELFLCFLLFLFYSSFCFFAFW